MGISYVVGNEPMEEKANVNNFDCGEGIGHGLGEKSRQWAMVEKQETRNIGRAH